MSEGCLVFRVVVVRGVGHYQDFKMQSLQLALQSSRLFSK